MTVRRVETAARDAGGLRGALPADVAVFAAAVADWRVADAAERQDQEDARRGAAALELVPNPDILATIAAAGPQRPRLVVGFAAETDDLVAQRRRTSGGARAATGSSPTTSRRRPASWAARRTKCIWSPPRGVEDWPRLAKARSGARGWPSASPRRWRERRDRGARLPHGADLPLPAYATAGAAGMDLLAAVDDPVTFAARRAAR